MKSEWKRMIRTPWNASEYPPTPQGKKAVRDAVKALSRHKDREYRWREVWKRGPELAAYIIEWR